MLLLPPTPEETSRREGLRRGSKQLKGKKDDRDYFLKKNVRDATAGSSKVKEKTSPL